MDKHIRALQARNAKNVEAMKALMAKVTDENPLLSAEDQAEFARLETENKTIATQVTQREHLVAEEARLGALEVPGAARVEGGSHAAAKDPKRGFRSFGEFCRTVKGEGPNLSNPQDERLRIGAATPTTFGNELSGQDGGFLVPPSFAKQIFTYAFEQDSLLPLTDGLDIDSNSMVFPKDETTPWGTDGVRGYWQAEAAAGTQTKPKLSTSIMRLYKLMALVPVTDELLSDTNALDSYLPRKTGDSVRWKTNEAILFGTGTGQPMGAFNSNAVVTVAKESGQATLTLLARNVSKMIARLPPDSGSYTRALWLINNDALPAVMGLTNDSNGTAGSFPIYIPFGSTVGGVQEVSPYGRLYGRPIMVTQHAKSFTAQGDVMLLDPYYIQSISRGAMETATSMHLYFDADATAFRTVFRVDSKPKIVNPIAPFNGSNNMSPFVQLGAR